MRSTNLKSDTNILLIYINGIIGTHILQHIKSYSRINSHEFETKGDGMAVRASGRHSPVPF